MPSIGETLREARMRQRLDIADVEARTKIRAKYLRALENEEFGLLPGSTFVKTFLRTYAEALGLDPYRLLEQYRAGFEPGDELDQLQPLGGGGRREPRYGRAPRPSRGAALAAIVLVLLGFLVVLGVTGEGDDEQRSAATETAGSETRPKQKQKPKPRPPTAVSLEVTPSVPTYVCLDNGPGTPVVFEGILQEAQTFKGKKLRINLGKTSVELSLNGKPFPIEPSANPIGYEFAPTGSKQLPEGQRPCA